MSDTFWDTGSNRKRARELLRFLHRLHNLPKEDKSKYIPISYAKWSLAELANRNAGLLPSTFDRLDLPWFGQQEDPVRSLEIAIRDKINRKLQFNTDHIPQWTFSFACKPMLANNSHAFKLQGHTFRLDKMGLYKHLFWMLPLNICDSYPCSLNRNFFKCGNCVLSVSALGSDEHTSWETVSSAFEVFMALLELAMGAYRNIIVVNAQTNDGSRACNCPLHHTLAITRTWPSTIQLNTLSLLYLAPDPDYASTFYSYGLRKIDQPVIDKLSMYLEQFELFRNNQVTYSSLMHSLRCYVNALEAPTESIRMMHLWQSAEFLARSDSTSTIAHRIALLCNCPAQRNGIQDAVKYFGRIRNKIAHENLFRHNTDRPTNSFKIIMDWAILNVLSTAKSNPNFHTKHATSTASVV